MIAMIEKLIARELAYQAEDKSVYFRINRFPKYGQLAHFDLVGIALDRPGEERRVRQGTRRRFRALESVGRRGRRCLVGESVGAWATRLAHRMQRDGDDAAR